MILSCASIDRINLYVMRTEARLLTAGLLLSWLSLIHSDNDNDLFTGMELGVTYCKISQKNTGGATVKVEKGDFGYIASTGYPSNYTSVDSNADLCNVELQACSTCKIRLTFMELRFPDCITRQTRFERKIRSVCVKGCDHLRLFEVDQPYHRSTERNYFSDAENTTYETISSRVVIQHCMSNTTSADGKKFYIKYEVVDKIEKIVGTVTSPLYSVVSGSIRSPNFPHGYVPNGETFTYMLQNLDPYGHVQLVFDDWDLAKKSNIQVYDDLSGPTRATIYGHRKRPTILSNTNTLVLVFNVGEDKYDCCDHIGFKATYTFVSDDNWTSRPNTDCSESYRLQTGGEIRFRTDPHDELRQWYDCVWTIKRYITNFPDAVMLRLSEAKFGKKWFSDEVSSLEIYEGVTSEGRLLKKYVSDNFTVGDMLNSSGDGLYIRLRGVFNNADSVAMVFTGVNHLTPAGTCPKAAEFRCANDWCIPSELSCDKVDHCGDNSDESSSTYCRQTEPPEDPGIEIWHEYIFPKVEFIPRATTEPNCYGKFRCHDDSGCINPGLTCDGYDHCRDRSDELHCNLYLLNGVPSRIPQSFPVIVCLTVLLTCLST